MINPKTLITVDLLDVSVAELEIIVDGLQELASQHYTAAPLEKLQSLAAWLDAVAEEVMKDGEVDQ